MILIPIWNPFVYEYVLIGFLFECFVNFCILYIMILIRKINHILGEDELEGSQAY
jgi:hypothetical protein